MSEAGFYNPGAFRLAEAAQIHALVDALTFGTLVSNGPDGPRASHLPFLMDPQRGPRGTLRGHLARANDHWQSLDGEPALVMFQGPAHYVSPSWYPSKAQTGKVVPTWNYLVVHVRGRVSVHQDAARLRTLVEELTGKLEAARDQPWAVSDAPEDYLSAMIGQIVGVELAVEHLEGKLKLGQNRPAADRAGLEAGLRREQPQVWEALSRLRSAAAGDGT